MSKKTEILWPIIREVKKRYARAYIIPTSNSTKYFGRVKIIILCIKRCCNVDFSKFAALVPHYNVFHVVLHPSSSALGTNQEVFNSHHKLLEREAQ